MVDDGNGRSQRAARRVLLQWALVLSVVAGGTIAWQLVTATPGAAQGAGDPNETRPLRPRPETDDGQRLFGRDCAVCHGPDANGTARGPSLEGVGTAAIHFMISTGRMPLREPEQELRRKAPLYTESEIESIVDYAATLISGPPVPDVEVDDALIARGSELFKLHCAACHQMLGVGGVLVGRKNAPTLHFATPVQTVEAIRTGPGTMPAFSERQIEPVDASAIATYVALEVQHPEDAGGIALGHFGPWSEGLVAWLGGIGLLLAIARWIGERT